MDLTGASESVARSVFMHVCGREADQDVPQETCNDLLAWEEPRRNSLARDRQPTKGWFINPVTVPAGAMKGV